MAWVDSKNIYDIVPQMLIIESLKKYKIFEKIVKFIRKLIKNWQKGLTAKGESLDGVNIQRFIF